ncbi:MAG: M67 family metallopeptidase [Gammaproteobacteria bacterium]|nr:M67 family metallopeptidase [Gammaproteobacteria bacterium]
MISNSVSLPRTLVNHILTHAQQAPNNEVCGLIGRQDEQSPTLYPINNIANDTHCLFRMDPAQQIEAMRNMREQGEELFAIYHSHPHAPGLPSSVDIEQASYPDTLYLIISLNTIGVLEMRGFYLRNSSSQEVSLQVYDAS